ncbi:hypothetical protein N7G274_009390 [Stereocaulon virgatum]|uniref:CHCH domain-containing protein n=1 Tax=Stereocaulon virgatum TaxID=373712 RepID=A0ABR3ZXK9_9LECA
MPRSRGGSGGRPSRSAPAPAPKRPAVVPPQQPSRGQPASTAAHPPATAQQAGPPAQQGRSPGLFGQMASTAAGVAVGSSIGHAIGGMFGGSSSQPAEQQPADNALASQSNNDSYQSNSWGARSCENDAKSFTTCLDENKGNMQICGWYLEQLKACQSAASQY